MAVGGQGDQGNTKRQVTSQTDLRALRVRFNAQTIAIFLLEVHANLYLKNQRSPQGAK